MEHETFHRAEPAERDQVLQGLALGFCADPFMRWLYPDPSGFLAYFPQVLGHFGGRAFAHESAFTNPDASASALWLPPDVHPDDDSLIACFERTVAADKLPALFATFEKIDNFHPTDPVWHLAFIAVDPARQGKGLGAALMKTCLDTCDTDGRAAYLESTNPANLSLYRRFGFEQTGVIQAENAPPLYPMLRAAR